MRDAVINKAPSALYLPIICTRFPMDIKGPSITTFLPQPCYRTFDMQSGFLPTVKPRKEPWLILNHPNRISTKGLQSPKDYFYVHPFTVYMC